MNFASGAAMQGSTVRRRDAPAGWAGSMRLLRAMGVACKGATAVALSLLDVLGYLDEIPVCTAYEIDGEKTDIFPVPSLLDRATPVAGKIAGVENRYFIGARVLGFADECTALCRAYRSVARGSGEVDFRGTKARGYY